MKRPLAIVCAVLGLVWLCATAVLLFFVANLAPIPALLLAFVAMDMAFLLAVALLIETNTRRAWPHDDYSKTTDELVRHPVLVGNLPYGRRGSDDRSVVDRLSEVLEDEAAKRKPGETPAWVIAMNQRHTDEAPDETQS